MSNISAQAARGLATATNTFEADIMLSFYGSIMLAFKYFLYLDLISSKERSSILKCFKESAMCGNMLDMAIGMIIGAACEARSLNLAAFHTGDGSKSSCRPN
jgi:hypothetical protein